MTTRWGGLIKRFHPEGTPWPGSLLYNALSGSEIFLHHYDLVARDLLAYGTAERILDVGTGPGRLLPALRKTFPNTDLVGVDISSAMLEQARRNLSPLEREGRTEICVASANNLPFADASFDRVVSTASLHHWKDPGRAISEVHRVLKDAGYALMYDLVRAMPQTIAKEVRGRFGGFRFALLWLHSFEEPFLSAEEMAVLGRESDFLLEGTRFTGALSLSRDSWPL